MMNARTLRALASDPDWVPSHQERAAIARVFAAGESLAKLEGVIAAMPQDVWRAHVLDTLRSLETEIWYWRVAGFFEHLSAAERCAALIASKPKAKFIVAEAEKLSALDPEQIMKIASRQPMVSPHTYAPLLTLVSNEVPTWVDAVWVEALSAPWPASGYLDPDSLEVSEACLSRLGSARSRRIVDEVAMAAEGTFVRAHSLLHLASADVLASAWDVFIAANLHSDLWKRLWRDAWQRAGRRYPAELARLIPPAGGAQALVVAEALGRLNLPLFAEANVALLGDSRKTVREVAKLNLSTLGAGATSALQVATRARKKAIRVTAQELLESLDPNQQDVDADVDKVASKHEVKTPEFWVDAYEQLGSSVWQVAATRFANEPQRFFRTPGMLARARPDDAELRSALFSTFCVIPRARIAYRIIEALVVLDIARAPRFVERLASAPHRLELVRRVHEEKTGTQEVWRALLLSPDKSIRSLATENVERTPELVATCAQLLASEDPERRVLGATLASAIEGEAARTLLAKFVSDSDRRVRDIAALDAGQSAPAASARELLAPFTADGKLDEKWGAICDIKGAALNSSSVVAALRTEDGSFTSATLMRLVPLLDRDDAAALSERLLDSYMEQLGDITRRADLFQAGWIGSLSSLLRFGRTPEELQPYGYQIGKWLMATLWQLKTAEADAWLHYWTRHATAPSIQREAWRRLATRAKEQELEPLAYMSRLDPFVAALTHRDPSDVAVETAAGEVKLCLVGGEVSIEVGGARRRSLPKDAAGARAPLKEFRSALRLAKKRIAADLEEAMVLGRHWTGSRFAAEREGCSLFARATGRLLCWFGDELGVSEDEHYVTADLETRKLTDATSVRVAHVAELDAVTLQAWVDYFADHELSQPFEQLARQSPLLDESRTTQFDKLRRRAAKLAWRNFGPNETIGALDRCYWGYGARALITVGKAAQKSGALSYTDLSGVPLALEEVHPVVVHESRRDALVLFQ